MSKFFKGLIIFFTTLGFTTSGIIIAYILLKGIPNISPGLFALTYTSENVSLMPALITTLITIILTLIFALPIGIFTAIYLSNYAKNKLLIKAVRFSTEILSSIPSIVLVCLVTYFLYQLAVEDLVCSTHSSQDVSLLP